MTANLKRLGLLWSLTAKDHLRYAPAASEVLARKAYLQSRFARDEATRLGLLLRAYRLTEGARLKGRVRRDLAPSLEGPGLAVWPEARVGWDLYPDLASPLNRTIVLKAPGEGGEKGVLLVMLEYNLLKLLAGADDLRWIDEHYDIIASTGWSPTDYAVLALALSKLQGHLYVQSCNFAEVPEIERFHPRLRCLPTLGCDWINPDDYRPRPHAEREVDLLMVANWAPFKRHWHFFQALRSLPASTRVTMIGQREGRHTVDAVRAQARALGVRQRIEFIDGAPIERVRAYQCNSKATLILSRREGCCVAVAESLFADAPVGMLRGAHVGPTAYINESTGRLFDGRNLGRQLRDFLEESGSFDARRWATEHISCSASAAKVNAALRDQAGADGRPWTADLKVPCWRPYPVHADPADFEELRPAYERLHATNPGLFDPVPVGAGIA